MRVLCLLFLLSLAGLSGCHSVRPVPADDWTHVMSQVHVGDTVSLTTKEGQKLDFKVTEINDGGISGEAVHVDRTDIRSMQMRQFSKAKTTTTVVAGSVALTWLIYIALIAAGSAALLGAGGG